MTNRADTAAPGVESFWETCDSESVAEHPLIRELCYRLDAIQRYRGLIADAEANGNDEALELLSRQCDLQHSMVRRIRDELARAGPQH